MYLFDINLYKTSLPIDPAPKITEMTMINFVHVCRKQIIIDSL